MSTRLKAVNTGVDILLERGRLLLIGRSGDCDVRIPSPRVSRRHCTVVLSDEGVIVHDLGSRNGTLCNGERITDAVLHARDELQIADNRYVVMPDEPEEDSDPSQPTAWDGESMTPQ